MKKIIAFSAVLAMLFASVAGCSSAPASPGQETSAAQTQAPVEPVSQEMKDVDLSVSLWSLTEFDAGKDAFAAFVKDKFKLNVTPVVLDDNDALKLAATSGSLPDVFFTGPLWDVNTFNSWVSQGIIRDVPDDMIAKYPNVQKMETENPTAMAAKGFYGKNWFIVVPNFIPFDQVKSSWSAIYYRKDWLANVGIAGTPRTYDDLYNMLKAFVTQDPDKNGKNDTYGLTMNGGMWFLTERFTNWGVNTEDWTKEDGKWIPGYLSEKCIEPLKYMQKLYQEGLIDTEFTTNNANQAMQKFAGNTFGAIARNADMYWMWKVVVNQFGTAHPDIADPFTVVGVMPPMARDANSTPAIPAAFDHDGIEFRAGLEDGKLDRYLMFHDWLLTDEANYYRLGFEGKEYQIDAAGKVVTYNDPATGQPYEIGKLYPATGLLNLSTWGLSNDLNPAWPNADYKDNLRAANQEFRDGINQYPFPVNINIMFISTPAKDGLAFDYGAEMANMAMSATPIADAWAGYVQKAMDAGAQQAIDEVNAKAAEMGIK
jgi:putative aldouronate transport system substrate-binding protein